MPDDLLKMIYPEAESPYDGLNLNEHPDDLQGWSFDDPVFEEVISKAKPKLVVEVSYDHFTGGRFRHGTSILRWRPDKQPKQCGMDQLRQKALNPDKLLQ